MNLRFHTNVTRELKTVPLFLQVTFYLIIKNREPLKTSMATNTMEIKVNVSANEIIFSIEERILFI